MTEVNKKTKIYVFCNGIYPTGDMVGVAIGEDGSFLASHLSSNDYYLKFDMGVTSEIKHDIYKQHYPNGFEILFVSQPREHAGLSEALQRNKKLQEKANEQ